MSIHAPRPDGDPDKALCRVRISQRPNDRRFATKPSEIDTCEMCIVHLCHLWEEKGVGAKAGLASDRWPWEAP